MSEGTFRHMVWERSKVRPLWSQVTEFIADKFDHSNVCNHLLCLLGVIEDEEMDCFLDYGSFMSPNLLRADGSMLNISMWECG